MPIFSSLRPRKRQNQIAFVFYATDQVYAVAVLVFVRLLKELGIRSDADLLVLHLPLSSGIIAKMHELGIITRQVHPLQMVKQTAYRHCLQKLRILELVQYERVLFCDADSIPLKSLDSLLSHSIAEPIAAPSAYWLKQPFWTTALLIAKPSLESWNRVQKYFDTAYHNDQYDMDIVNYEFGESIQTLPRNVFALNSEWEDTTRPAYFPDPTKAFSAVSLVHFTALGKPWQYSTNEAKILRPNAHPAFYEMWQAWRSTRDAILSK